MGLRIFFPSFNSLSLSYSSPEGKKGEEEIEKGGLGNGEEKKRKTGIGVEQQRNVMERGIGEGKKDTTEKRRRKK